MFDRARKSYIECQDAISKKLTSKLASYDYPVMAVGTCLLALVCCLFCIRQGLIYIASQILHHFYLCVTRKNV